MDEEFASILTKIFNLSIRNGEFIEDLKLVKVISIFKNKGSSLDTGNYRLLSNIDKIFEKIVHKRMSEYLEAKNMSRLTKLQKSAIRIISFSNNRAASMLIFKDLGILPIPSSVF